MLGGALCKKTRAFAPNEIAIKSTVFFDEAIIVQNINDSFLVACTMMGCARVVMRNGFGKAARFIKVPFKNPR